MTVPQRGRQRVTIDGSEKKFSHGNFPSWLSSVEVIISEFDNTDIFAMKSTSQPCIFHPKLEKDWRFNVTIKTKFDDKWKDNIPKDNVPSAKVFFFFFLICLRFL